jgi:AcrR family transcriptional regulator
MKTTEDVREKILTTAGRLFYKLGYNATGINQIIEDAGVARASLYYHFKSKNDLLHAYLESQHEEWFSALEVYVGKKKTAKEAILAIFDYRMGRQVALDFGGCPFIKASMESEVRDSVTHDIVNRNKDNLRLFLIGLVKRLDKRPSFMSAEMLTDTLFLLLEGASAAGSFQKRKDAHIHAKKIAMNLLTQK